MIEPSRSQFLTTAQAIAAANARLLLESEPRPAFDISNYYAIACTNPDAMEGQRNYTAIFYCVDGKVQKFDGRHWENFPA